MKKLFLLLMVSLWLGNMAGVYGTDKYRTIYPAFRQLVVSGNVRVTVLQSKQHGLISYTECDPSKTKVQQQGLTLYIRSNETVPLEMVVYVDELFRIDVSGTAVLKTRGAFDVKLMQVFLHDQAKADVKMNVEGLYTVMEDQSDLTLRGATKDHILAKSLTSKLNTSQFAVVNHTEESLKSRFAGKINKPSVRDTLR